jgi:hypothetical protein
MSIPSAPVLDAVFTKLAAFLATIVPTGTEIVQGLGNRVPMPVGPFIAMTPILQTRLDTNQDTYADPYPTPGGARSVQQNIRLQVQLDCYGPDAGDWATTISTLLRDDYGVDALAPDAAPLYVEDPRQVPFISGEEQYVTRWTVGAILQYNPVTALPQDFAAAAVVDLINVDEAYPP